MKYKAVLFDMDGTILNSLYDLGDAMNVALESFGYPPCTYEQTRDYIGDGVAVLVERGIAKEHLPVGTHIELPEGLLDAAVEKFNEYYSSHNTDKTAPFKGMPELIKQVRAAGCKTAVVSNKTEEFVKQLAERYFPDCFDIIAGNLPGAKTKPDPELLLRVMGMLGLEPSDCIFIGDTEIDIMTCRNAECDAVLVDWGNRDKNFLLEHGAKIVVSDAAEIPQYL